jgi:hypothetical protein
MRVWRVRAAVGGLLLGFGCLVSWSAPPAPPGETAPTVKAKGSVFNAKDYGAVGDDRTDNTAAFSACLKAMIEAGGGRMELPAGVYRGRILIPAVSKLPSWITLEIAGASEPTPVFGTVGSFPLQSHGTIIKCLAESGEAVISAAPSAGGLYEKFSAVYVVLKNLDVRTDDDPKIDGIDLRYAVQCRLENVVVGTGVYSVQASKPTRRTCGLRTPACNNAALTILQNVLVTGYQTGIVVEEHTNADNINVAACGTGLEFATAHHASRFGRVCACQCVHVIGFSGKHAFAIDQLNVEYAGKGQAEGKDEWKRTTWMVYDPDNLGVGDLTHWVVEGNVGAVETFPCKGGTGVRARRIGAAPAK